MAAAETSVVVKLVVNKSLFEVCIQTDSIFSEDQYFAAVARVVAIRTSVVLFQVPTCQR